MRLFRGIAAHRGLSKNWQRVMICDCEVMDTCHAQERDPEVSSAAELYGRPWSEAEFIIILNAFFERRGEPHDDTVPFVIELSNLLGRTPAAISMRLENYAALDPALSHRDGLNRGGPRCKRYFDLWSRDLEELKRCANVLVRDRRSANLPGLFEPEPVKLPEAFSGRYELYDAIGEGTFSTVLSCLERDSGRRFAMKILKPDLRVDREAFGRFRREIRALRELNHPLIIRIHDDNLDQVQDVPAFVMDLADCSLRGFLEDRQGRDTENQLFKPSRPLLNPDEAIKIVLDVMEAVRIMHATPGGLVHRDINPNNILRKLDGRWSLGDFGLSKFLSVPPATASYKTEHSQGGAWGTEPYAAPEQWRDFTNVNERVDIFAVGVLIWDLFTTEFPPMDRAATGLNSKLEKVFLKAVQRQREDRYCQISELRDAFSSAVGI